MKRVALNFKVFFAKFISVRNIWQKTKMNRFILLLETHFENVLKPSLLALLAEPIIDLPFLVLKHLNYFERLPCPSKTNTNKLKHTLWYLSFYLKQCFQFHQQCETQKYVHFSYLFGNNRVFNIHDIVCSTDNLIITWKCSEESNYNKCATKLTKLTCKRNVTQNISTYERFVIN